MAHGQHSASRRSARRRTPWSAKASCAWLGRPFVEDWPPRPASAQSPAAGRPTDESSSPPRTVFGKRRRCCTSWRRRSETYPRPVPSEPGSSRRSTRWSWTSPCDRATRRGPRAPDCGSPGGADASPPRSSNGRLGRWASFRRRAARRSPAPSRTSEPVCRSRAYPSGSTTRTATSSAATRRTHPAPISWTISPRARSTPSRAAVTDTSTSCGPRFPVLEPPAATRPAGLRSWSAPARRPASTSPSTGAPGSRAPSPSSPPARACRTVWPRSTMPPACGTGTASWTRQAPMSPTRAW